MKILKFVLICFLIGANVSCSSDDDNDNPPMNIDGSWTLKEGYIPAGSTNINLGGMSIPVQYSGSFVEIDENNRLNFQQDNTFTSVTGNIALEMDLTVMGSPQTQSFEGSDLFGQGTWELNGSELLIHNENGTTIKYYIDKLEGNVLQLSSNVKDMNTGTPNPMLESMDIIIKMTLERV